MTDWVSLGTKKPVGFLAVKNNFLDNTGCVMSNIQQSLIIGGIDVRKKAELYCLNDLHKAAGGERRHEPGLFLENQNSQELIAELKYRNSCILNPVETKKGKSGGTFAVKQIVYAYAMWISPKFNLAVIDAYDALVSGEIEKAKDTAARAVLKDEYRPMTDSVLAHRHAQGKEAKHYHYSNEADMINRAVTGMSAKQFKEKFNCGSVRDNLTTEGKKAMLALQRANTALLDLDMDYQERKDKLGDILKNRFSGRALIEAGTECLRIAA